MKHKLLMVLLLSMFFLSATDSSRAAFALKVPGKELFNNPYSASPESNIEFGQTLTGNISVAAEVDSYTFEAEGNDIVLIRVSKISGDLWPRVRLFDHLGNLMMDEQNPQHVEIVSAIPNTFFIYLPLNLAPAGINRDMVAADSVIPARTGDPAAYTIVINDGFDGSNTGSYNLHLQRLNPAANPTPVAYAQTLPGTISMAAATKVYEFSGEAGDQIIAGLSKVSGEIWMGLRLYGPQAQLLVDNSNPNNLEINYKLPFSGNFTLLAYDGFNGTLTGSFNLFLQRLNPPVDATTTAFAELKPGSISLAAEMDSFTFAGTVGDYIIANLGKVSGDFWTGMRLLDPEGQLLIEDNNPNHVELIYPIPVTGDYTLLIYDGFNKTMTGNYNLFLQRLNPPVNSTAISYGQTLPGSVSLTAELDSFNFSGGSGDNVLVTVSKISGDIWPGVRLLNSDGQLLNSDGGPGSAEINYTLPATGSYTIIVHDSFNGNFTGNYNLNLQNLP